VFPVMSDESFEVYSYEELLRCLLVDGQAKRIHGSLRRRLVGIAFESTDDYVPSPD